MERGDEGNSDFSDFNKMIIYAHEALEGCRNYREDLPDGQVEFHLDECRTPLIVSLNDYAIYVSEKNLLDNARKLEGKYNSNGFAKNFEVIELYKVHKSYSSSQE